MKTLGNEQKIGSHSSDPWKPTSGNPWNPWRLAVLFAQLHVMIGVLEVLRGVGASTQHAGQARGNDHRLGGWPPLGMVNPEREAADSIISTSQNSCYCLVNIRKTMEHHRFQWENPLFLWPCSIAMEQITRG